MTARMLLLLPDVFLWSWPVAGKGAMVGPSSLAAVSNQAVAVEVKAGEPVQVDVPVLTSEGKEQ